MSINTAQISAIYSLRFTFAFSTHGSFQRYHHVHKSLQVTQKNYTIQIEAN